MDTARTPPKLELEREKTSGNKSKPTSPSSKPAASPKTRWKRSRDFRASAPPAVVAATVRAAKPNDHVDAGKFIVRG